MTLLVHASQADNALREIMPVVEWLTIADAAEADGVDPAPYLRRAREEFHKIKRGPLLHAYIEWLEQNTAKALTP